MSGSPIAALLAMSLMAAASRASDEKHGIEPLSRFIPELKELYHQPELMSHELGRVLLAGPDVKMSRVKLEGYNPAKGEAAPPTGF